MVQSTFPTTCYYGAEYFCDREEETNFLLKNAENGNSTTLMAIRRIGKTGLIEHMFGKLLKNWKGIYLDILETENLNHFLNNLTSAILKVVPQKDSIGKKFWDFVKSMRPIISFDPLTGEPRATFELKREDIEININSVFQFLDNLEFKVVIAIDEFQQICNYPEKNTDAWLRSRIQQLKNVIFIFSGSQQHLMAELFSSPKRPFFRSTQLLKLDKIDRDVYRDFIISMFRKYKKEISPAVVNDILEWTNIHTYYVQLVCNKVFAETKKIVNPDKWKQQAYRLLKEQEPVFFAYRNMITNPQWQLLKAIARESRVYMPTSKHFLTKHQLGTSATVLRSLKTLLDYELVYYDFDSNGEKFYSIYDVLFQRWSERK